jgi:hypothetical protein
MIRMALAILMLAVCVLQVGDSWSKKKDGTYPYDQDEFLPPGQAKPKGPPPWAPAHGYRAKQNYRYYPAHNIYQDPVSGLFFTYHGGVWSKGGLPPGMTPDGLGRHRDFDGYVDEPWKSNPYSKKKKNKD